MPRLRPFFSYYGAKWTLAPKYPAPRHDTIIEPFAGSACYSLLYPDRDVILVERDEKVAAVWRYLIAARADEIRALPLLAPGDSVDGLELEVEARWLIGFWMTKAAASPVLTMPSTAWATEKPYQFWGSQRRERIAAQVDAIGHWTLIEGDFTDAPELEATWHIDSPYQGSAGLCYRQKFDRFDELGDWCRSRRGQVMVCENMGADWLPFETLTGHVGTIADGKRRKSTEAIWTNHRRDEGGQTLLNLEVM